MKYVYSKKAQSKTREKQKTEQETNYKENRTKEQWERITRCESPSPRTIMKRTSKKSKQLVIGSV